MLTISTQLLSYFIKDNFNRGNPKVQEEQYEQQGQAQPKQK